MLHDIWPTSEEVLNEIKEHINKEMFLESYKNLDTSNKRWNELPLEETSTYNWSEDSTYIHNPPFF